MIKLKYLLLPVLLLLLTNACTPSPQPIEFGSDLCAHCKMAIVDKPFAAEAVTSKGRVYKFDAIECMVFFLSEKQDQEFIYTLVRDFYQPEEWQPAAGSFYLVSENLPSPMGAYLSAYQQESGALQMQQEKGGEIYTWEELKNKLKR